MALLAESLVEEWLNRNGFFTIRGVKRGIGEIDLLAIRPAQGAPVGWHVEVQASFRPVGYISKLTKSIARGRARTSAASRTAAEVEICAKEWVHNKFLSKEKHQVRNGLWNGLVWEYHLVHAIVREEAELDAFKHEGVKCHSLREILSDLVAADKTNFSGSAGGDLAEILSYHYRASPRVSKETGGVYPGIDLDDSSQLQELEDLERLGSTEAALTRSPAPRATGPISPAPGDRRS